jgi:hypothetical protein
MNIRRIIGIIAVIGGIVLICISRYIKSEILAGNEQISSGEKQLSTMDKLFSLNPSTKPLGDQMTSSGRKKIAEGREEIAYYTRLANQLQIGGIILIVAGGVIFITGKKRKK